MRCLTDTDFDEVINQIYIYIYSAWSVLGAEMGKQGEEEKYREMQD